MDRQAIYNQLITDGASHEEADFIANMTDEEMVQFVADCGGDWECLPKELHRHWCDINNWEYSQVCS